MSLLKSGRDAGLVRLRMPVKRKWRVITVVVFNYGMRGEKTKQNKTKKFDHYYRPIFSLVFFFRIKARDSLTL